ncbi:MAG: universal stress protein [Deltaproteobacteria bacterium]|nr:universal stress protein [Deltaproteobacteria bacterium]
MFKKVLAATDLLEIYDRAVLTAAEIAQQNDAKLYILHVLESAYSGKYRHFVKHFETGEEIVSGADYEEAVKEKLDKTYGEALKPFSNYQIKVTVGFPWEQTLKWARKQGADLIVLGPHSGRAEAKGVARTSGTIGSTAQGVIMHERCPVMIVNRPILKDRIAFDKIMVCIDFSESCKYALQFAIKMAQKHGSELFIFHVFIIPSSPKYPQGEIELEVYGLEMELKTLCKEIPNGIEHEYKVWESTLPHLEIIKYARENDIDLIAMGSHTKEKGEKWYVGSAVEQVSSRSMCPVAVVTDPKALWKMGS